MPPDKPSQLSGAIAVIPEYRGTTIPLSHLEVDHIGAQDICSAFLPFVYTSLHDIPVGPSCLGTDLV